MVIWQKKQENILVNGKVLIRLIIYCAYILAGWLIECSVDIGIWATTDKISYWMHLIQVSKGYCYSGKEIPLYMINICVD